MSYDDAVKAENTVHHNAEYSSRVLLPVTKIYRIDAPRAADE